jgi:hypothetical protein
LAVLGLAGIVGKSGYADDEVRQRLKGHATVRPRKRQLGVVGERRWWCRKGQESGLPLALGGGGAGTRVEGIAAPLGRPARRGARRVHVVRPHEVVGKWVGCDRQSPSVS